MEWSVYQNVHYFIRSTRSVVNFTAVRYSLHKCSETILRLKRQFNRTRVTRFLCTGIHGSKKNLPQGSCRTSIWSIPYSGELCNKKMCRQDFRDVDRLKRVLLHCRSDKSDAIEGVPDRLIKWVAMVFRVHRRHVELLLTYWCSKSAIILNFEGTVCNNWT